MEYRSRRFPIGPPVSVALTPPGLAVQVAGTERLWPWSDIRQVELRLEYRKHRRRRVLRIWRADGAHVELLDPPWTECPTPYGEFVHELHRQVGERSPEAWFGTRGIPIQGGLTVLLIAVWFCVPLLAMVGVNGIAATLLPPDLRPFTALVDLGLGAVTLGTVAAFSAVVWLRARPRRWSADDIPPDLL